MASAAKQVICTKPRDPVSMTRAPRYRLQQCPLIWLGSGLQVAHPHSQRAATLACVLPSSHCLLLVRILTKVSLIRSSFNCLHSGTHTLFCCLQTPMVGRFSHPSLLCCSPLPASNTHSVSLLVHLHLHCMHAESLTFGMLLGSLCKLPLQS